MPEPALNCLEINIAPGRLPPPASKLIITQILHHDEEHPLSAWIVVGAICDSEGRVLWSTELFVAQVDSETEPELVEQQEEQQQEEEEWEEQQEEEWEEQEQEQEQEWDEQQEGEWQEQQEEVWEDQQEEEGWEETGPGPEFVADSRAGKSWVARGLILNHIFTSSFLDCR